MNNSVWRFAHASVIGTSHVENQTDCQDRFHCQTIALEDDDVLIAVVADGAGSASHGGIGASIACRTFVDEVVEFISGRDSGVRLLNDEFARRWVRYSQTQIAAEAAASGLETKNFATTLVGAVIGLHAAAFFQIGDGGCVLAPATDRNELSFALTPPESEYVNMTTFVTDADAESSVAFRSMTVEIGRVAIFTDGIFPVAVDFRDNKPHGPFLRPMFEPLEVRDVPDGLNDKLAAFLASPRLNEKTDDDKTLILAARNDGN